MRYDLAIAGAGPAGSVLALLAARKGLRVLLVDRSRFAAPRIGETAPPELRPLLVRINLAHLLDGAIHMDAPGVVSVWGGEPVERAHILSPFGNGVHLDRRAFDRAVAQAAQAAGADLQLGAAVRFQKQSSNGYSVVASNREVARARFVALAGGRAAACRGFSARHHLDDQVALAARFGPVDRVLERRTIIEAIAGGWFYVAALPHGRMIAVLMMRAADVRADKAARHRLWLAALSRTKLVQAAVPAPPAIEALSVHDARASFARQSAGDDWCLVGDARFAPDALSGRGIVWAIEDAIWVATALTGDNWPAAAGAADARTRSQVADYCAVRAEVYGWERRFPQDGYWRSRQ